MERSLFESHRRTVETPSGSISCVDVGDGPAAVFVHGVGTNALLWRKVIAEVADQRRCIAVDLPLHGRSPAPPDQDLSLPALAAAVLQLCDGLTLGAVDLVANDTGGAVAQVFAATHPQRLRTLALTNCDVHDNLPPEAFMPIVELAASGELAQSAEALLADLDMARAGPLGAGYERPDELDDETIRSFLLPVLGTAAAAQQFERCLTSLDAADLVEVEPALKRLQVPTLVVWGTGDEFFDLPWAYWLRDTIPGVTEVVEVPGAKLFFPDERPGELVPHLRRHWTAYPPRATTTREDGRKRR